MPLQSTLFGGDPALEKCLVEDRAHLVEGSHGPHVRKVQQALALLDGALIALTEVVAETYGPDTAAAVLDYKRARSIINFSYQTSADAIVGKMTIASLDQEMSRREARPRLVGCLDETRPSGSGGGSADTDVTAAGSGAAGLTNAPQVTLRVVFQDALAENEIGIATPTRILLLSAKAQKLLLPFNITLSVDTLGSFPFPLPIGEADSSDVEGLRKAAQKANAGSGTALRVIFCKFRPTTSTGVSHGRITGIEGFDRFVLINKEKVHPDFGTLLHEMIHCSNDGMMSDLAHDGDPASVFSFGPNRPLVTTRCLTALRGADFK